MSIKSHKEFPKNIKDRAWSIYAGKKQIVVDGFKHYSLKELKKIDLNTRLSFPYEIFVAIDKA